MLQGSLRHLWNRWLVLPRARFVEGWVNKRAWEHFYLVFGGHIFFQTLRSAVRLGIFDLLDQHGPLTLEEIAQRVGIEEQPARVVLLGCTAVGLVRKRRHRYCNSKLASRLLVHSSPERVTSYVELEHRAMYPAMGWMLEAVRENRNVGIKEISGEEPTLYERLAHDPEVEQIFQDAMRELSAKANPGLARFVDFSRIKHVVDVGGGDGTNLLELCRRWPHLRGTVFESPTVCEVAKKNIARAGFSDRISVRAGNCFSDPLPQDADCVMLCHFMTIWGEEQGRELLRKCFRSLPRGGRVVVFNMMQRDDGTGPLSAAVGSPYFLTLATGKGMLYSWKEYEAWLSDAGFEDVKRQRLQLDHGVVIGSKPQIPTGAL